MKRLLWFLGLLLMSIFSNPVVQCQELTVQTDTGKLVLSRTDLEALTHVKVTTAEHSTGPVSFEGVTLKSVLEKAGVMLGESLKGKQLSNCLLVEGADGYRVVIALRNWTRRLRTSGSCWLFHVTANRSMKRKVRTES